jgi:hypothetical protein
LSCIGLRLPVMMRTPPRLTVACPRGHVGLLSTLLSLLTLTGCAALQEFWDGSPTSTEWVHPTKPKAEFSEEYYECRNDMMTDPKALGTGGFVPQDLAFKCMQQKGWRQGR